MSALFRRGELETILYPCYYKDERESNPYELELMLWMYLLQNLYAQSDEATVAKAIDR